MDKEQLTRGSRVIWDRGGEHATITDGPFNDVPGYPGPCYVIHFRNTARLVAEEVLRLEDSPKWIPCFGEHRKSDTVWERLETEHRQLKGAT